MTGGISQSTELQHFLFLVFLLVYGTTWLGNLTIIITVIFDSHLHTPMYLLLANLAFLDFSESSVTAPKMLKDLLYQRKTISFNGCLTQMFFFHFIGGTVVFFLVVMAPDRYVAIYKPLHYLSIMNRSMCMGLVAGAWLGGFVHSIVQLALIIQLPFCGPNTLDSLFLALNCFVFIIVSYVQIFKTVLRIPTEQGRHKAFSTCLPHLTVVSLLICTGSFAYLKLTSSSESGLDLVVGVLYSLVPPVMNPIIYSMRNKDIKAAWKKLIVWWLFTKS
uniref:G-protein coupled receptors family 1 profile domain-containing protein n=1 Tax=Chrysemys picta bellii TaxID=8478 RepID=A0A8C3F596_CHRPI